MNAARERRSCAGSALLVVVAYTAVISLFASLFWNEVQQRLTVEHAMAHRHAALCAAEAGIERALAALGNGASAYAGDETEIGDGAFRTYVEPLGEGRYRVRSEGRAPLDSAAAQRVTLQAELRLRPRPVILRWEVVRP